jgi:hypothetical protein
MPLDWTPGGDTSTGGTWASEPGTYHLGITNVQDPPIDKNGAPVSNGAFRIECEIMGGTVPSQVGKTLDVLFFHPKGSDDAGSKWARKKIDRFLIAVGLATQEQIEAKTPLKINPVEANGRQLVARFEKEKEDTKYLSLAFADIFHVDDPAVKDIPKNTDALKLISAKLRRISGKEAPKNPPTTNGAGKEKQAQAEALPASNEEVAAGWGDV